MVIYETAIIQHVDVERENTIIFLCGNTKSKVKNLIKKYEDLQEEIKKVGHAIDDKYMLENHYSHIEGMKYDLIYKYGLSVK